MTISNDPRGGGDARPRADRIQNYRLIREAALTALQIIHRYEFPTGAGQQLSRARPVETGSGEGRIQDAELVGDDDDFLSLLTSLHETIRASSTDLALPTRGSILWSDLIQAVRSGERARDHATALCDWIEEYFHVNSEEDLHFNPDLKILMVGKDIYDASGCFIPCKILAYYYMNRNRIVRPMDVWLRVLDRRGSVHRVKEMFESLPSELRGMVESVPGAGRIWRG